MKKLLILLICLLISGCASQSQILVNLDTGVTKRCASSGWGWAGAPLSAMNQSRCIDDLKSVGFVEIEKAATTGIGFKGKGGTITDKADDPAIITSVHPRGPAYAAGVKKGDIVIERDGEKITCIGDLIRTGKKHKVGDIINYKIMRGDVEYSFNLKAVSAADILKTAK